MRIVYSNAADRAELTAAPDFVATLPATNLLTQYREEVARTSSLTAQDIMLTWAKPVSISACILYRNNLSATATMRLRIYDLPGPAGTLVYDSGTINVAVPKSLGELAWGIDPLGASQFDGWGYSVARHWMTTPVAGQYAILTLADPYNTDGYMQASRLFLGLHFESTYGPEYGAQLQWGETTVQTRTEGGSLRSEPGATFRSLKLSLRYLPERDRLRLSELLRAVGMRGDLYVSVFPGLGSAYERDHQMQAKLVTLDPTTISRYGVVDQSLQLAEV